MGLPHTRDEGAKLMVSALLVHACLAFLCQSLEATCVQAEKPGIALLKWGDLMTGTAASQRRASTSSEPKDQWCPGHCKAGVLGHPGGAVKSQGHSLSSPPSISAAGGKHCPKVQCTFCQVSEG